MPDESNSITPPGASAGADPSQQQAVVDLCIARRTLMIYPASHDQVKRSLQRAYNSLSAVLVPDASITLTVMKEDLRINNRVPDSKSTAFSDLAAVFRKYQIAALTIFKGLEFKEFVRFLRLMATKRDKIMAQGGIASVAAASRLNHVMLRTLDYSKLQMTEESEIQRSSRRESDGFLRQAFVSELLSEEDPALPKDKTASVTHPDPNTLAALLNRGKLKPGTAIAHYERAMADAAENRTTASPGMSQGLQLFQQMIKALNPELQKQFLASTFDHCAQAADMTDTDRLYEGPGADLIIRMLDQANSDGKQVSPSLIAFIGKVGRLNRSGEEIGGGGDGDVNSSEGLSRSKVESLLAHEQYDTYVDSDYHRIRGSHEISPVGLGEMVQGFLQGMLRNVNPLRMLASLKSLDEYTFTHAINVCILTMAQAEALGIEGGLLHDIGIAASMHDAGKMFISDDVLNKPDKLTEEEWQHMRTHAAQGAQYILRLSGIPRLAFPAALEHHLRYDGTGYPDLGKDWRPNIVSQMIAIADIFDAMRSRRPYKEPKPDALIIKILQQESGSTLNPHLVRNFLQLIHPKGGTDNER